VSLALAVVGNCAWAGLLDRRARLVWACLPRFDSDPIFPALLDDRPGHDGTFTVDLVDLEESEQHYDGNTAILVTVLRDRSGGALELRDFAPRFSNHGRMFRPTRRPLRGEPRARIFLRPRCGWGAQRPGATRGSNHLRFVMPDLTLRLSTDAPISYVMDACPFVTSRRTPSSISGCCTAVAAPSSSCSKASVNGRAACGISPTPAPGSSAGDPGSTPSRR